MDNTTSSKEYNCIVMTIPLALPCFQETPLVAVTGCHLNFQRRRNAFPHSYEQFPTPPWDSTHQVFHALLRGIITGTVEDTSFMTLMEN